MHTPRTFLVLSSLSLAVALTGGVSHGQDKAECVKAAEQGQQHKRQGALTRALESFQRCARENCPPVIIGDCSRFLRETEAACRPSCWCDHRVGGGG